MPRAFQGRAEDVAQELRKEGAVYGISIGRRAPVHKMHVDCIREIAEAGLKPVIIIGSTNGGGSYLFDPLRNPFTVKQQKEQLKRALPGIYDESLVVAQPDNSDDEIWHRELKKNIEAVTGGKKAVMHFRAKAEDAAAKDRDIKALSHYADGFLKQGFLVWQSFNKMAEDDAVNATAIRRFDLERLTKEQRELIAAPDYIVALARAARARNPDKSLLEKNRIPLTVFDLTLDRMRREAGIGTAAVVKAAGKEINLVTLAESAGKLIKDSRSIRTEFSAAAQNKNSSRTDISLAPRRIPKLG